MRIFIGELIKREFDPRQQPRRLGKRRRIIGEQPCHFGRRFQMALGIGGKPRARFGKRRLLGNAGQHIMQPPLVGRRIERRIDGEQRHLRCLGMPHQRCQPPPIRSATRHGGGKPAPPRRQRRHLGQLARRHGDQQQIIGMIRQIIEAQDAIALFGAAVAQRQQPRQPPPAEPRCRIGDDIRSAIGKAQPRADNQPKAGMLLGRDMRPHHTRDAVAIGDADANVAERLRRDDHLRRRGRAAQKAEMRPRRQFGKAGHANSPCRYQPGTRRSAP